MNDLHKQQHTPAFLSAEEKADMKRDFMAFMEANPVPEKRKVLSPYFPHLLRIPAMVATLLLIVGGTAYAAEQSLPTDFLYPVKTSIIEPLLIEAPARTPLAKAKASHELVERRLEEAEELVEQDQMDAEAASVIVAALEEHTNDVQTYVAEASSAGELSDALDVGSDLESTLEAHSEVLESITDEGEVVSETVENLIEKIADQADEAEGISETLEEEVAGGVTEETDEYLNETKTAAEVAINGLRTTIETLSAERSEELVIEATALLTRAEASYASGTEYLAEGKRTAALPELRDALQNADQGTILLESHEELSSE